MVDPRVNGFDPSAIVRDFDWGKTRQVAGGRTLREWQLVAYDKEIEIVAGVRYAAWTYNGRVPGPTLRAREGDLLRMHFVNAGTHPHTIHFHGIHPAAMDGTPGVGEEVGGGLIEVGEHFTYEFEAQLVASMGSTVTDSGSASPSRTKPMASGLSATVLMARSRDWITRGADDASPRNTAPIQKCA